MLSLLYKAILSYYQCTRISAADLITGLLVSLSPEQHTLTKYMAQARHPFTNCFQKGAFSTRVHVCIWY